MNDVVSLVGAGFCLEMYLRSVHRVSKSVFRTELLNLVSMVASYCVISICCFARFMMQDSYRRKILSNRFIGKRFDFFALAFCGVTVIGVPHLVILSVIQYLDLELVAVFLLLVYVVFLAIDKFDVDTKGLIAICLGAVSCMLSFNFGTYTANDLFALGSLTIAMVCFFAGILVYRRSSLVDDVLVSSALVMVLPVVLSGPILLCRFSLDQIMCEFNSISLDDIQPLFTFCFIWAPSVVINLTNVLGGHRVCEFGLVSVFHCSFACLGWTFQNWRQTSYPRICGAVCACGFMFTGGVIMLKCPKS